MEREILVQEALNAVPITRTPWGGQRIAALKRGLIAERGGTCPDRIGESWEVSTGNPFPSRLRDGWGTFSPGTPLEAVLVSHAKELLGAGVTSVVGAHSPLLLKWLHAQDVLSLQVHPALGDSRLAGDQEGKPECWLVLERDPGAQLYLGFLPGPSKEDIIKAFETGREKEVLYSFEPEPGEYIGVPPGCVHAIGPGVLLAEPQFVLPAKEGVTLRVSDWNRRYNDKGELDPKGAPRPTHWERACETIDWSLPRGDDLRAALCRKLAPGESHDPGDQVPFPVQIFRGAGPISYEDLVPEVYSVVTVWAGVLELGGSHLVSLQAGETALVAPAKASLNGRLEGSEAACAFFSIRLTPIN